MLLCTMNRSHGSRSGIQARNACAAAFNAAQLSGGKLYLLRCFSLWPLDSSPAQVVPAHARWHMHVGGRRSIPCSRGLDFRRWNWLQRGTGWQISGWICIMVTLDACAFKVSHCLSHRLLLKAGRCHRSAPKADVVGSPSSSVQLDLANRMVLLINTCCSGLPGRSSSRPGSSTVIAEREWVRL